MAAHVGPVGSVPPKSVHVAPIAWEEARALLIANHYTHTAEKTGRYAFGVFVGGRLVGAALFGPGPRSAYRLIVAARRADVLCLTRFWLSDELGRNAESRVLGYCLRWLQRNTPHKAVVTYADPAVAHDGTIYRATGFIYCGRGHADWLVDFGDGTLLHRRTVYDRFGAQGRGLLARTGVHGTWHRTPGKLCYVRFLDDGWRWRLIPSRSRGYSPAFSARSGRKMRAGVADGTAVGTSVAVGAAVAIG